MSLTRHLNWRIVATASAFALALLLLRAWLDNDFFGYEEWDFDAFIFSAILIIFAIRAWRRSQKTPAVLSIFILTSSLYPIRSNQELRAVIRWQMQSHRLKPQVLATTSVDGFLQHAESEATGFAGVANNTTYAVYDPTDRLSEFTGTKKSLIAPGLPCKVWQIRRLESHWYSVLFYTDEEWNTCNQAKE